MEENCTVVVQIPAVSSIFGHLEGVALSFWTTVIAKRLPEQEPTEKTEELELTTDCPDYLYGRTERNEFEI